MNRIRMKSSSTCCFGACFFLFALIFVIGCTENISSYSDSSFDLVPQTVSPPSFAPEECPLPTLIFNNSQEFTELHNGLVFAEPGEYPATEGYPIPVGSIIYHTSGPITRIFDPSGKQILIVNDSVSSVLTKGGYSPVTVYYNHFPGNLKMVGNGGKYFIYYLNESDEIHPCYNIVIYSSNWTSPFRPVHQFSLGM